MSPEDVAKLGTGRLQPSEPALQNIPIPLSAESRKIVAKITEVWVGYRCRNCGETFESPGRDVWSRDDVQGDLTSGLTIECCLRGSLS